MIEVCGGGSFVLVLLPPSNLPITHPVPTTLFPFPARCAHIHLSPPSLLFHTHHFSHYPHTTQTTQCSKKTNSFVACHLILASPRVRCSRQRTCGCLGRGCSQEALLHGDSHASNRYFPGGVPLCSPLFASVMDAVGVRPGIH